MSTVYTYVKARCVQTGVPASRVTRPSSPSTAHSLGNHLPGCQSHPPSGPNLRPGLRGHGTSSFQRAAGSAHQKRCPCPQGPAVPPGYTPTAPTGAVDSGLPRVRVAAPAPHPPFSHTPSPLRLGKEVHCPCHFTDEETEAKSGVSGITAGLESGTCSSGHMPEPPTPRVLPCPTSGAGDPSLNSLGSMNLGAGPGVPWLCLLLEARVR